MFSDPEKNLKQFGISDSMRVVDLGAGSGFYTLAAARMMQGGPGKVYACEVQQELAEELRSAAEKDHLSSNIEVLWVNIEKGGGTKLTDESMDAAIISNVLFQIEDKNSFSREAVRILKKGGKILLIDWSDSFNHMGPHPDHVVTKETARALFERAGLTTVKEIDAGAHHYGIILSKI